MSLPTPESFPAFPFDPPYSIQVDLMKHVYSAIENRKIAIVESPTGTVRVSHCGHRMIRLRPQVGKDIKLALRYFDVANG